MFSDLTFAGGTFADLFTVVIITEGRTTKGRTKVVAIINGVSGKGIAVNVDRIEYRITTKVEQDVNDTTGRGRALNIDEIKYRLTTKVEADNTALTAVNKID